MLSSQTLSNSKTASPVESPKKEESEKFLNFPGFPGGLFQKGLEYPVAQKDDTRKNYQRFCKINKRNADQLGVVAVGSPFNDTTGGSAWTSITAEGDKIHLSTHEVDEAGKFAPDDEGRGGYVSTHALSDLSTLSKTDFSDITGVAADFCRPPPTLWNDYEYLAAGSFQPQTLAPLQNVVRRFEPTLIPYPQAGQRKSVICRNKRTGQIVWQKEIGEIAQEVGDLDNWLVVSAATTVVEVDLLGDGIVKPVLVVTTSSVQSFAPWFASPNNNPFGPAVFNGPRDITFTDRGRIIFMDAFTGKILNTIFTTPEVLKEGDTVPASSLRPGKSSVMVYQYLENGMLDNTPAIFAGDQQIAWLLQAGNNQKVPTPLDGVAIQGNDGVAVTLVGGSDVPANMNSVHVYVNATMTAGASTFSVGGTSYNITDAAVQLYGQMGLGSARVKAFLPVGHILNKRQAYQLNYWGVSIWASSPVVRSDRKGVAKQLIIGTGQNHGMVPDEALAIIENTKTFVESTNEIAAAQQAYEANPNAANWQAYLDALTADEANLADQLQIPLSERGQNNHVDSLLVVDLSYDANAGVFGSLKETYKTTAYDVWNLEFRFAALRDYYGQIFQGVQNIQSYIGLPLGYDGDAAACPHLLLASGPNGEDMLLQPCKSGFTFLFTLADLEDAAPVLNLLYKERHGFPGNLGGCNMGFSSNRHDAFIIQANSGEVGNYSLPFQTGDYGSLNPSEQQFMSRLKWFSGIKKAVSHPVTPFELDQSYMLAYDFSRNKVNWEVAASPQNTAFPFISTIAVPTCTDDIVAYSDGAGVLHIKDVDDGSELNSFDFQTGGMTAPLIGNKEIVSFSGRKTLGLQFPLSQYSNGQYLYKLARVRSSGNQMDEEGETLPSAVELPVYSQEGASAEPTLHEMMAREFHIHALNC